MENFSWNKIILVVKGLIFLGCIILPINSFAELTTIKDYGETVSAEKYLSDVKIPSQSTQTALLQMIKNKANNSKQGVNNNLTELNDLLFPAKSNFTVGKVKKHRLQDTQTNEQANEKINEKISEKINKKADKLQSLAFYVVGDDDRSIKWLKKNAEYFKEIGALGFLTNVKSHDRAVAIERETGANLLVVSLDNLESMVGTSNYPFLVYKGWVIQ